MKKVTVIALSGLFLGVAFFLSPSLEPTISIGEVDIVIPEVAGFKPVDESILASYQAMWPDINPLMALYAPEDSWVFTQPDRRQALGKHISFQVSQTSIDKTTDIAFFNETRSAIKNQLADMARFEEIFDQYKGDSELFKQASINGTVLVNIHEDTEASYSYTILSVVNSMQAGQEHSSKVIACASAILVKGKVLQVNVYEPYDGDKSWVQETCSRYRENIINANQS